MKLLSVDYSNRVYGLDIFRAVAILLVVFGHAGLISGDLFYWFPSIPLIDGVELFFVLSGFLIGTILIKSIENNQLNTISQLFYFWKRRWLRTIPAYYFVLILNFIFIYSGIIKGDINQFSLKFLFFLQNFTTGFYEFFWESWSLAIEEWFYLLVPIFLFLFRRFLSAKQTLLITIILFLTVPILLRFRTLDENYDWFWFGVNLHKVVIYRLDAIVFGVAMAYFKFYHVEKFNQSRYVLFLLGLAIIYANIYIHKEPNDFYAKIISFSVTSFGASLLLPLADSIKSFKNPIIGKSITFISLISYSMYLVNLALVAQVLEKNFPPSSRMDNAVLYVTYWFSVFIFSYLLYRFIEKPMMDLRK